MCLCLPLVARLSCAGQRLVFLSGAIFGVTMQSAATLNFWLQHFSPPFLRFAFGIEFFFACASVSRFGGRRCYRVWLSDGLRQVNASLVWCDAEAFKLVS